MRVLRSQYMQLQESYTVTTTVETNKQQQKTSRFCALPGCQEDVVQQKKTKALKQTRQKALAVNRHDELCDSFQIPTDAIKISAIPLQPNRRKTMSDMQTSAKPNNFNIKLLNTQGQTGIVKLVVHFYNEGPQWYTQLCRSYEGDLWKRILRPVPTKYCKWFFQCHLCSRRLSSFESMKAHLNIHLGLRPHRCADCTKKYPSRKSLYCHHKKTKHEMQSLIMGVSRPASRQSV